MPPGPLLTDTATPFDPANFWFAYLTAAGIYALSCFPVWDRVIADWREGKPSFFAAFSAALGILVPLGVILQSLESLATDPVPSPQGREVVASMFAFGVAFAIRALIPIASTGLHASQPAQTATTTVTTASEQPTPLPRKSHGDKVRDAALAALVLGALVWGRRER